MKIDAAIVPATDDHRSLVIANWLRTLWDHSSPAWNVRKSIFFREHEALIKRTLESAPVLCAVDPADQWHVYGWLCAEPTDLVHFAYVKPFYRRKGILTALLAEAGIGPGFEFTALVDRNPAVNHHEMRMKFGATYNPYRTP